MKLDLKKELGLLYKSPKGKNVLVDIPEMKYLMIDGVGSPGSIDFTNAIEALYAVSYTIKFLSKRNGQDYAVMPLEALWYADDMDDFIKYNYDKWKWTLMIMQPEFITRDTVAQSIDVVRNKKNPVSLSKICFESYYEGSSAQVLYIGPYSEEEKTIASLHDFIHKNDGKLRGKHHEIYLSDARKVAPEKLKTIIRQPFDKK